MTDRLTDRLTVYLADRDPSLVVGEMVDVGNGPYFQYDSAFLGAGLSLSPLALPLRADAFAPGPRELGGLRGLFADALPDGWGLKMLHQTMKDVGLDPLRASRLTQLHVVGDRAMGALVFKPSHPAAGEAAPTIDLDALAENAIRIDADDLEAVLPALKRAGGSPGGARPKVVVAWHPDGRTADAFAALAPGFRHVLVKFRAHGDWRDMPAVESAYLTMARKAGIEVAEHRVAKLASGELALIVDRFDRVGDQRRHVHSLAGLLEVDVRHALVDYEQFLRVAARITEDMRQVAAAFRRAVFNVAVFNRDDHAKNVAFRMSPDGTWALAPAYDLTFSEGPNGYHSMSVMGESRDPARGDLERLGAALDRSQVVQIIDEVRAAVDEWPVVAKAAGVSAAHRAAVARQLASQAARLTRSARAKPAR